MLLKLETAQNDLDPHDHPDHLDSQIMKSEGEIEQTKN